MSNINIYTKLLTAMFMLAVTFCSCTNDLGVGVPNLEEGTSNIFINLKMPAKEASSPSTYAMNAIDENQITTVDVLVFKIEGSQYKFYYRKQGWEVLNSTADGSSKTFKISLDWIKTPTEQHQLVILANATEFIPNEIPEDMEKDELLKQIIYPAVGKWNAKEGNSNTFVPFPMWGESGVIQIDRNTPEYSVLSTVKMLRSVAKIDVGLNYSGDTPQGLQSKFKMESVYVYNTLDSGYVAPTSGSGFDGTKVYSASLPDNYARNAPIEYKGVSADNYSLTGQIYVAENGYDPQYPNVLIIGGRYSDDPLAEGTTTTYYKLVINDESSSPGPLLRNHRYRINITDVTGEGWSTPDEAYYAREENMEAQISTWDEGEMDAIRDEQNVLRCPSRVDINYEEDIHNISVFTNCDGGWTAAPAASYSWITVRNNQGTVPNIWDVIEIEVQQNASGVDRVAEIAIQAGRMIKILKIYQSASMFVHGAPWQDNNKSVEALNYTLYTDKTEMHILRGIPGTDVDRNNEYFYNKYWDDLKVTTTHSSQTVTAWIEPQDQDWLFAFLNQQNSEYGTYRYAVGTRSINSYDANARRQGKVYLKSGDIVKTVIVYQDVQYIVIPKGFRFMYTDNNFRELEYTFMVAPGNQLNDANQNWYWYMNLPNNYAGDDYEGDQLNPPRSGSCAELNANNFMGYTDWRLISLEEIIFYDWYGRYSGQSSLKYGLGGGQYRTSTNHNNNNLYYSFYNPYNGNIGQATKSSVTEQTYYARCVRTASELD